MFQEIHNKIVQRQLQMRMVKNYLKKDNIFRKKVKKLLMTLDLDNNDIIMEYQKTAEAASDLLVIKLQKSQKIYHRIIQKQLNMNMIKKYLKKDIYLQKNVRKLLMI